MANVFAVMVENRRPLRETRRPKSTVVSLSSASSSLPSEPLRVARVASFRRDLEAA